MTRRITSAQFMHLWEATGLDRMPHPFEHRTGARLESEWDAEQRILEHWAAHGADPGVVGAIDALRRPDVSVSVHLAGAVHPPGAPSILRRGAIRGRICVVAEQLSTSAGTGDIRLQAGSSSHVPDVRGFVRVLLDGVPENSPGRTVSVSAYRRDLERRFDYASSVLQDVTLAGAPLLERILSARTTTGHLCLHRPWRGAEDPVVDSLTWFDVAGDGRYLCYEDDRIHLRAATPGLIGRELEIRVRKALEESSTRRARALPWSPCRNGTGTPRADH